MARKSKNTIFSRIVFVGMVIILTWFSYLEIVYADLSAEQKRLAKKHFNRGIAAVEIAKDSDDYQDAVAEFTKAVEQNPIWFDALYNLALVQAKVEAYRDALTNLNTALQSASTAEETEEIQSLIDKIEYKIEKKNEKSLEAIAITPAEPVEDSRPIMIPEIGARVDYFKFFESSQKNASRNDIVYTKYFNKQITDRVHGEIGLSHPAAWSRTDFAFEVVYIKPDGNVMGRWTSNTYVTDGWQTSYHNFNWGWNSPGYWQIGRYQAEVYHKGNLIAAEEFTVY